MFKSDYLFHKITFHLVNHLVSNNVSLLIFGHNKGQKQDINLGKEINQNNSHKQLVDFMVNPKKITIK